ncbi:alpha/beta hydrolase [Corynebacterium sp. YIM 101645]|uniref:Alpha/beta hydrolase n=1 Tax=Corynebacterium lemuris TaxID=1859292 RepID=A0ABT2G0G0_9CORY|nr:alpha/beta hydrolase [Corynebacterium lemuris]MCS5480987.1 alpha/beta hydrolase [Corynebacterium lemuris]
MATFVLIHAAATDSSCWHLVSDAVRRRGHDVIAVDLPVDNDSADLSDYAATVLDAVGEYRDVVVVGHSFGGFTAPLVAHGLGANLLVMLQAQIPQPGETPGQWWSNTGHAEARRRQDEADGRDPDAPLDPLEIMLHDTPVTLAKEMLAHQRDQSATPFEKPWPLPEWPTIPTRVLVARDDRFFPLEFMRRITRERLRIEPDVMPGDHCPMLGHPEELANRLVAYWNEVR